MQTDTPCRSSPHQISPKVYNREVDIAVCRGEKRTVFCVARSTVTVYSDEIEEAVQSGQVGVGQLFRRYNLLPEFRLLDAGRTSEVRGLRSLTRLSARLFATSTAR